MALNAVLGQAVSRNKAHEKVDLWKEREVQDRGSRFTVSLKSKKGDVVRQVTKVPEGAEVTSNGMNQFDDEREANAAKKEDMLLERLSSARDPAWRPDLFFTEMKGEDKLPWKLRPQDLMKMDANLIQKVMAAYEANKKSKKAKKEKKAKKGKKDKKNKKDKKDKKNKKEKKEKDKKAKKEKKEKQDKGTTKRSKDNLELDKTKAPQETLDGPSVEVSVAEARASHLAKKLRKQAQALDSDDRLVQLQPSPSTEFSSAASASSASSSSEGEEEDAEESEDAVDWGCEDEASESEKPLKKKNKKGP
mmetsp:Transcript_11436/g.20213  ORF Transcript_11436/g.20213 Transcript_11436/m.20213 type:complete len:305 (-) Transcript_11436:111-1025(-)|eukprot:CAMPEP_0197636124 /NCGR_PEP_ID=MMETSP1338-20131121/11737_1 /TAXON_ID=43686 ORGANISM="Pelagodinium beii, Strain RCC1491" /NCGR_SAMPLE_ID=MMETSP1338 /ASSEMBLY_ACC=CAM_ASM_000754 /LENGTH=304 /DNA_ID=CAMNT_0043208313 /DNA_START=88 /DNA_END=1002 /DNA_ORIENTATION=-